MKRPRLTRRLILEAPSQSADGAGGFSTVWTEIGVHWAELVARTGRERAEGGLAVSSTGYRITVRAAPQGHSARPRPEQRFRDGSRIFSIRAVSEADAEGMYLICIADEEVVA